MPDGSNQVSGRQRRANWVGLRTLHQIPKAVGETDAGDTVYEVRSVRVMLDPSGGHFVRLVTCTGCARELAGAAVTSPLDLEKSVRPLICAVCIAQAGAPTASGSDAADSPGLQPAAGGDSAPRVDVDRDARLPAIEHHLRAVTRRVNELASVARAHQSTLAGSAEREEAVAAETAALRAELVSVRAELGEARAMADGVAALQVEVDRLGAEVAAARAPETSRTVEGVQGLRHEVEQLRAEVAGGSSGVDLGGDVARLARQVAALGADLGRLAAATNGGVAQAPAPGPSTEVRTERELERRLVDVATMTDALGERDEALELRVGVLAAQVAEVATGLVALADRVDELGRRLEQAPAGMRPSPRQEPTGATAFLAELDLQLDAASRRLAARSGQPPQR